MLVSTLIEIPQIYLQYGAAIGLGILAIIFGKRNQKTMFKLNMDIYTTTTLIQKTTENMHIHTGIGMSDTILMNIFTK